MKKMLLIDYPTYTSDELNKYDITYTDNLFNDEVWKDITFNNISYTVSNKGRVITTNGVKTFGYQSDSGYLNHKTERIHRIIAYAFLQKELLDKIEESKKTIDQLVVNHKDRRRYNNNINNLEWVTYSENNYKAETAFVNQYDKKNRSFIQTFESIKLASESLKKEFPLIDISKLRGSIEDCLYRNRDIIKKNKQPNHSSRGYIWIYTKLDNHINNQEETKN